MGIGKRRGSRGAGRLKRLGRFMPRSSLFARPRGPRSRVLCWDSRTSERPRCRNKPRAPRWGPLNYLACAMRSVESLHGRTTLRP